MNESENVDVEVFELKLAGGCWYWRVATHQLLRGPFPTEEEARADVELIGGQLLSCLMGIMDAKREIDALTRR